MYQSISLLCTSIPTESNVLQLKLGQTRTYALQKRQPSCAYPSAPACPSPARGFPYPLSPPSTSCTFLFCPWFRKVCLQGVCDNIALTIEYICVIYFRVCRFFINIKVLWIIVM
ncbi:Hypothetical_protein [Hexamita inflata]|uniref:Hypothetical_protein n=1 Tax=Hexamita inflata TaxID=28002 RepID=A0AA86Q2P7_9EUKA|nr:Hypothetical protein HINF_LOCUS38720 [Hexamita inflata]